MCETGVWEVTFLESLCQIKPLAAGECNVRSAWKSRTVQLCFQKPCSSECQAYTLDPKEPWKMNAFLPSKYGLNNPSLGIRSLCQRMLGVSNHLLSKVFRFHYHSQKVIGSLRFKMKEMWNLMVGRYNAIYDVREVPSDPITADPTFQPGHR